MANGLHPDTLAVTAGYDPRAHHGAVKPPLYATSTFTYRSAQHAKAVHERYFVADAPEASGDDDFIYARLDHPNMAMLQARLALLDGGEDAAVFNCGIAAINAVTQAFLRPGDSVLHTRPIYGGTDGLLTTHLAKFAITPTAIDDALDPGSIRAAAETAMARGRVGLVMVESPANPTSSIADIAAIALVADEIGARQRSRPPVMVDNTFLGPFQQNPLRLGADLCMTSLTKYAGGHSDLLAGGVSGGRQLVHALKQLRTLLGSQLDAHTSWMVLRSLETMSLRTERAGRNARAIAEFLRGHRAIVSVNYVGFQEPGSRAHAVFSRQCSGAGSTFTFRIRGGEAEAFAMLDRLRLLHMAVSLGGTETLICHPATTTHINVPEERRLLAGIDGSTLRISVGIEHAGDLIADLRQGLDAGCQAPEAGCQAPEAGCQAPEAGCQAPEAGCQAPEAGCQAPEAGCQAPEAGCQAPEAGCQAPEAGCQAPEAG